MKWIKITADKEYLILADWDNYAREACPELKIKVGDDMVVFYRNHKDEYEFEGIPYYTKPYTPDEKLAYLMKKQPNIQRWIDRLDLVLSI